MVRLKLDAQNYPLRKNIFKCLLLLLIAAVGTDLRASAQGNTIQRDQARSMVISTNGIVAAESPLAAQAGVQVLSAGGNAIDAAVATNAAMGVVAPMANGMGGDLFAIIYEARTGKVYGLNASGWAPEKLTADFLHGKGLKEMPSAASSAWTYPEPWTVGKK